MMSLEEKEILERLQNCIINLVIKCVQAACNDALAAGITPVKVVEYGLSKGMIQVGQRFEAGEFFLSELMMASEVMKEGMKILEPHIKSEAAKKSGKVVIGTVQGDLHDIGKNLVVTLLRAAGFEVIDLGVDVSAEDFVKSVRKEKPSILAMSALLTLTLPAMENVVKALEHSKLRKNVKVIIGGAPVTAQFGKKAKVDFAAENAIQGVNKCREWISGQKLSY